AAKPAADSAGSPTPNQPADPAPATGQDQSAADSAPAGSRTYVSTSRRLRGFLDQAPTVLRFYRLLILPIALAAVSIGIWLVRLVRSRHRPAASMSVGPHPGCTPGTPGTPGTSVWPPERFLVLLVVWWLLDMAFVWISPHSYEQYYLPLTASGAFLGGYGIGSYHRRLAAGRHLGVWLAVGAIAGLIMILMAWPIVFGLKSSPHTGSKYDGLSRGYVQKYQEISQRQRGSTITPWEGVADYIRTHSTPQDAIYVWGWYPGIYVRAQRLAPTREAAYGTMHSDPPDRVERLIRDLVRQMEANPPRYLVDTQKMHFPFYDHPVYDLWPRWLDRERRVFDLHPRIYRPAGKILYVSRTEYPRCRELFLEQVEGYCQIKLQLPSRQGGPLPADRAGQLAREERARQAAMEPLRDFVMRNYVWRSAPDSAMLLFEHVSTAGK
ncbi:MAG: hypothetical protein JW810_11295, partial [Sedimentisphaerales bacterium]|nr:hypothetical protein [Sedimentisphaerales bacterium]